MPRIDPIKLEDTEPRVRAVLEAQASQWGAPLGNHLIYAHRPSIFKGARGMWAALDGCARLRRFDDRFGSNRRDLWRDRQPLQRSRNRGTDGSDRMGNRISPLQPCVAG